MGRSQRKVALMQCSDRGFKGIQCLIIDDDIIGDSQTLLPAGLGCHDCPDLLSR